MQPKYDELWTDPYFLSSCVLYEKIKVSKRNFEGPKSRVLSKAFWCKLWTRPKTVLYSQQSLVNQS